MTDIDIDSDAVVALLATMKPAAGASGGVHAAPQGKALALCGAAVTGVAAGTLTCGSCVESVRALHARLEVRSAADRWRKGDLRFLLDGAQQVVYDKAKATWAKPAGPERTDLTLDALRSLPKTTYGALCSRRFGKSTIATAIATEIAIREPGSPIFFLAKDQVDAQKIATDIWRDVFADSCPKDVRPEFKEHKGMMMFPNGSYAEFAGVNDGKADDMRGRKARIVVCDEIGSWQKPDYVIKSVVTPAITTTHGSILVLTTPASVPNHESTPILNRLEADGRLSKHTIIDSKRLTDLRKAFYLVEAGETETHALAVVQSRGAVLPKTSAARREYFVLFDVDSNALALPEARDVDFVVRIERRAA